MKNLENEDYQKNRNQENFTLKYSSSCHRNKAVKVSFKFLTINTIFFNLRKDNKIFILTIFLNSQLVNSFLYFQNIKVFIYFALEHRRMNLVLTFILLPLEQMWSVV